MEGVNIYIDPITIIQLQQGKIAAVYVPELVGTLLFAVTDRTPSGIDVVKPILPFSYGKDLSELELIRG